MSVTLTQYLSVPVPVAILVFLLVRKNRQASDRVLQLKAKNRLLNESVRQVLPTLRNPERGTGVYPSLA